MKIKCYECGERISKDAEICPNCGARQSKSANENLWKDYKKITPNEENVCPACGHVEADSTTTTDSEINKTLIGVLAILFGAYGIHHFLMGHIKRGVLSMLFFWTLIPTVFSIIEGIRILCMSEEQFQRKYLSEQ